MFFNKFLEVLTNRFGFNFPVDCSNKCLGRKRVIVVVDCKEVERALRCPGEKDCGAEVGVVAA